MPTSLRDERILASKQFHEGAFRNTHSALEHVVGPRGSILREWMFGGQQRRPPVALPIERPHELWTHPPETGMRATWLGHSTVLLELDGRRVLTDPVFARRIGPVSFA